VHWYYFAPAKALAYFSAQDRGHYNIKYNSPGSYTTTYAGTTYPITDATVYLPWPESELELAPHLTDAPVAFDFSKLPNY
jgi:hypothetical protein